MGEVIGWTATVLSYGITAYVAHLIGQYRGFVAARAALTGKE